MDGSSSQPHTEQPMSPIHSFPTEDMYSPQYSNFFQHTARKDSPDKVAASPPKSKPTRGRQKRTAQNEDAPLSTACTNEEEIELCKVWDASINMNVDVGDDEEDEVQELRRPMGRDKAKGLKEKGSRSSGSSSSMNDETLAGLMVSEMAMHNERVIEMKKKEHSAFLEIIRREMECLERELTMQEYQQRQKNIMFYMQLYDHLTGDARRPVEEMRAVIKEKWDLEY
ncbi:hypothetical protein Tco_0333137 [Tanacetum coccineum]